MSCGVICLKAPRRTPIHSCRSFGEAKKNPQTECPPLEFYYSGAQPEFDTAISRGMLCKGRGVAAQPLYFSGLSVQRALSAMVWTG
jgi:hypothetical protein